MAAIVRFETDGEIARETQRDIDQASERARERERKKKHGPCKDGNKI